MHQRYSDELLKDVHIRLDKHGLEGLSKKEMMVLLSEDMSESREYLVAKISPNTTHTSTKIEPSIKSLHFWLGAIGIGIWVIVASLIVSIILETWGG